MTFLIALTETSRAFSLLGPIPPWLGATNQVEWMPDRVGGPMTIGSGYRWNVPVVTYGFDESFLNYFGSNGVAAVEAAIRVLNDLPPVSQIALTNYPLKSAYRVSAGAAASLEDLQSYTLSLLMPQLGLASPHQNIFVLRNFDAAALAYFGPNFEFAGMPVEYEATKWSKGAPAGGTTDITNYIGGYSFDPQSLEPSGYINGSEFGATTYAVMDGRIVLDLFPVDPYSSYGLTIADRYPNVGVFYTGLTRDDVGGLRYLLSTNNVTYETLLQDVQGTGTNSFVNGGWRPGIDKITFVPQRADGAAGGFLPMTNQYIDIYISNGIAVRQPLQRVTVQPDFLFSAGNDEYCTGVTNWINNSALNNHPDGDGPGVIQPPIVIEFQKAGEWFNGAFPDTSATRSEESVEVIDGGFGSFDGSTNAPLVYPVTQTGTLPMVVRLDLSKSVSEPQDFRRLEWSPLSPAGTVYAFQTCTNLETWHTLFEVTNNNSVVTYFNSVATSPARFYRLILRDELNSSPGR